ncbi:hypothetical protein [Roseobacter weihaiensis]|uniref:hypothetical protein n=1 Tax=Roseobacter weihaiensis TaxID=2763262 RepID=UPI001D0B9FFC|nr:hypothetical protein [Roseobacter sp. H9]
MNADLEQTIRAAGYEPSEADFIRAAEIIRAGDELEDSHLDIRASDQLLPIATNFA